MNDFERKLKSASESLNDFFILHPKLKILFICIFVVLIFLLLAYFTATPSDGNTRVTDASLTQFNVTNNNTTLNYDLSLNISLRNTDLLYYGHYDHINIIALYKNQTFGRVNYTSFSQGPNHGTRLTPSFRGQYSLNLDAGNDDLFIKTDDCGDNYYDIVITVELEREMVKIRSLLPHRRFHQKFKHRCELKVPLISKGQSASGNSFNTTACHAVYT